MKDSYKQFCEKFGPRVKQDEPLSIYTTLKIGGPADLFVVAKTHEELAAYIQTARSYTIPVTILGGGSNVLIADNGVRGLVIKNLADNISIKGMKKQMMDGKSMGIVFVKAESGTPMNKLVRYTIEEGLSGLHMHLGLPGSVGGALFMNSKWSRPDLNYVGDVLYQATILTPDNKIETVPQSYFQFAYDYSLIQKTGDIVLSAVFTLVVWPKDELWKLADESVSYRRTTQPQGVFSPGCTFRNITKAEAIRIPTPGHTTSAGFLVDHAECKNMKVGDAAVSPIHANFIVNTGKAKASDVVQLIEQIRSKVMNRFGVILEEEIVRIGDFN